MYSLAEIKDIVIDIAKTLPIRHVILVGSYAKEQANENSDIDLIIDGEDLSETYWDFLFKLEDRFNANIDLLTFRGLKNSCIKESILDGGIVIYEAFKQKNSV